MNRAIKQNMWEIPRTEAIGSMLPVAPWDWRLQTKSPGFHGQMHHADLPNVLNERRCCLSIWGCVFLVDKWGSSFRFPFKQTQEEGALKKRQAHFVSQANRPSHGPPRRRVFPRVQEPGSATEAHKDPAPPGRTRSWEGRDLVQWRLGQGGGSVL